MLFFYGFLATFILSILCTYFAIPLFARIGLVDRPDNARKKHSKVTPLGGGVGIILSALTVGAIIQSQLGHFTTGAITQAHLLGVVGASLIILLYGYLDDRAAIRPQVAIFGPVSVAIITVLSGFEVTKVTHPFGGELAITPLISAVGVLTWMLVLMYAVKLADGVDGLVASLGMSSALMIGALALSEKYYQPDVALMAFLVMGGIGGFLLFNWAPASIFLGEIGSVWIGYAIAILAIISGSKLLTALMVLVLPIADLLFVVTRRVLSGRAPWAGDRLHLHHLLLDRGWRPRAIVCGYVCTSLLLGALSLVLVGWQKIAILVLIAILIFIRFVLDWYAKQKH